MDNYETAKLLVSAYTDAITGKHILDILPDIDITNRLLVQQQLRLHVLKQLLQSKHQTYFLALSDRQFATLLKLTPKTYKSLHKDIITSLLQG